MITALIIGIGSGVPEQLTGEAIAAMKAVEVFLVADKREATHDLVAIRDELCRSVIGEGRYRLVEVADPVRGPDAERDTATYTAGVEDWHLTRARGYAETIGREVGDTGTVGFLVWGDPSLYDSTIRIVEQLAGLGLEAAIRVVPGISSVQLLAAAHRTVLNRIGQPVHITTGRRLLTEYDASLGDVVVMLDGRLACAGLIGRSPALQIYWGAQLGLADEALVAGPLAEVIDEIRIARRRHSRGPWLGDGLLPASAAALKNCL